MNHMNSSLDNYLVNGQMARNKVRVKGIEILSTPFLLSTDIFVYTQFGDTYKWQIENRDPRKRTPIRVFNTNCKPPTPSLNSSWYQVSEVNTPIQCSDRIAFEVGRVLFNLTFRNTSSFDTTLRNKGYVTVSHRPYS